MQFIPLSIPDVILIKPEVHVDERGFFLETWQKRKFTAAGIDLDFVQDNHSRSSLNTLRGLHYQVARPQGKLVRSLRGEVFDVAVDLRRHSRTCGKWVGHHLSGENKDILWIPPGFAHGFYVLSEIAEFQYKCTDYYNPDFERCIRWDDTTLQISWPLIGNELPLVSQKDGGGHSFDEAELYV